MALLIFNQFYQNGPTAIEVATKNLLGYITTAPSQADALYQTNRDILAFSCKHPEAIDFSLLVFHGMANLLPSIVTNHYGPGETAARKGLAWFLREQVRSFDATLEPTDIGEQRDWDYEGTEYANMVFRRDEVTSKLNSVVQSVIDLQSKRRETVIAWAVQGRAQALDVTKVGEGEDAWLPIFFQGMLDPASNGQGVMPPWSKADYIAACVGLRAGAKSYLEGYPAEKREGKLQSWKERLSEFLLEGDQAAEDQNMKFRDGDFLVKFHTAVSLFVLFSIVS